MGFDDYGKPKKKYYNEYGHTYAGNRPYGSEMGLNIFKKILNNRKLKTILIIAVSLLLIVIIGLIVLLFPFLAKIVDYMSENGVQGLVELVTEIVNKIWTGAN
jgi:hypothetical protein